MDCRRRKVDCRRTKVDCRRRKVDCRRRIVHCGRGIVDCRRRNVDCRSSKVDFSWESRLVVEKIDCRKLEEKRNRAVGPSKWYQGQFFFHSYFLGIYLVKKQYPITTV